MKKPIEEKRKAKKLAENGGENRQNKGMSSLWERVYPYKQPTDFSVQRIAAIRQGRIRQKPIEKRKKEVIIIVSVYVLCVAVLTGLHTVSRNSVPRNVKR